MREPAARDSWTIHPLPEARARLPYERAFSQTECERLRLGFIPADVDDHWFIYHEDDWLYFHRSWTGFCVYQLRLEPVEGGCRVAETWVSRDPEQYRYDRVSKDEERRTLNILIDRLLLEIIK